MPTRDHVKIVNIRQNDPDEARLRNLVPYLVYADLVCAYTGELRVAATLAYVADAIRERGYILVA